MRLEARFMVLAGAGILMLAISTLAVVSWFEHASARQKFHSFSKNELKSLQSLVESAMAQRLDDRGNIAIKVFNDWFHSHKAHYPGQLWIVWSPKLAAYMAKTQAGSIRHPPLDRIDQEVLRTGKPKGAFVKDAYRYSLPVILGKNSGLRRGVCETCHSGTIGQHDGDVIAVFSSSVSTVKSYSALRTLYLVMAGGTLVAVLGVILGIRLIFRRVITEPLANMTEVMRRLARGDKTVNILTEGRYDEIGEMANAVRVFKDNMCETERLRAEQKATEARIAQQRQFDARQHSAEFQSAVSDIVDVVSSASIELENTASALSDSAEINRRLSASVAATSKESSLSIQAVASASEELATSVDNIARQVLECSTIANEAVSQARETDSRISELSDAAQSIGDVVKLITSIAGKTNLLALNATIEAARAGEAGRGFSVVAQEVKALATQTAKATGEIESNITNMQAATQDSIAAIKEIATTIDRISKIAAAVDSAVKDQEAATVEISRNVQQVADATGSVAINIAEVSRGVSETGSVSENVLSSARSLSRESTHLKAEVDKILAVIRGV